MPNVAQWVKQHRYLFACVTILMVVGATGVAYAELQKNPVDKNPTALHASQDEAKGDNKTKGNAVQAPGSTAPATQSSPTNTTQAAPAAQALQNPYTAAYGPGFALGYVWDTRTELGKTMPGVGTTGLGNNPVDIYYLRLVQQGQQFADMPSTSDIVLYKTAHYQAGIVEQVNDDGSIWLSEMNGAGQVSITDPTPIGGWNRVDYRLLPPNPYTRYYIH